MSVASSIRSNDTALINTPAPKPMISPMVRKPIWNVRAISAPITSEDPASTPHPNAAPIATS